jgi:surface antigen
MKKAILIILSILTLSATGYWAVNYHLKNNKSRKIGEVVDSLNGVFVYENGSVTNVSGRNITKDNYNLGLKFQCVEFVKRYYYEHLNHKMPDSYGHAKDYFDKNLKDGERNRKRGLIQYSNGSKVKPKQDDIIILSPTIFNRYGHVAIVASISKDKLEVIQQNPGPFHGSRETYSIENVKGKWFVKNDRVLGWLRK